MKRFYILVSGAVIGITSPAIAQQNQDIVHLKNGNTIKGVVIEHIPKQIIKVQTKDGSLFVYEIDDIEKITKEAEQQEQKIARQDHSDKVKTTRQSKVRKQYNDPKNIFGAHAGVNLAKRGTGDFTTQTKVGFYAGASYQRLLFKNARLYLETGTYFSMKGYEGESDSSKPDYAVVTKANPMYIQIPILLNYKFHLGNKFVLSPYAGGYCAIGIAGNLNTFVNGILHSSSPLFTSSNEETALMHRFDFGILVGLNVAWKRLSLNIGYEFGQVNKLGYSKCFTLGFGHNF